jgi:D-3-phosphoglycerate dehydrogenase / 2-oxoglutarate reductase
MEERKILIVDSMHESIFPLLDEAGWNYDYEPDITRNEIRQVLKNYSGLIIRSKTIVDADLLGDAPTLRFIGRAGAGIDNLDQEYLQKHKINVLHAAEGNREAVGEFTAGLILSLLRNIPRADAQVRNQVWNREGNRGEEINGKTIALIGHGNMGRSAAQCLSGFGCKILAYDKYKSGFGTAICTEVNMGRIFEEADILSLHIPLTSETRAMVNIDYFRRFRKNIVVVNTARGEIIRLQDLNKALEEGKVRGAALDVLENERIGNLSEEQQQSFNNLKTKSNVIFTPHIAGWTYESHVKINVVLVDKIKSLRL